MLAVQKDVYSASGKFLAAKSWRPTTGAGRRNPALDPAIALLRTWNGQMDQDLAAPFLITLVYQHVRTADGGKRLARQKTRPTVHDGGRRPMEKLLRERPEGWFGDYDADAAGRAGGRGGRGRAHAGPGHCEAGTTARYLERDHHPPGDPPRCPLFGKYFDIGPVPMSGSSTTVKQTTHAWRPRCA